MPSRLLIADRAVLDHLAACERCEMVTLHRLAPCDELIPLWNELQAARREWYQLGVEAIA